MKARLFRRFLRGAALVLSCSLLACDENPEGDLEYGTVEITTTAPTAENEIRTADGWVIKHDKFVVNVSAINVAGLDAVLTASATAQTIDQVKRGPKLLLTSSARLARPWEVVSFEISPAKEGAAPIGVEEPDLAMMVEHGWSIHLVSTAAKGAETKSISWGFSSSTTYKDCEGELDGVVVKGMLVRPNGTDTADIGMRGDVFFSDKLDGTGALAFDAIAAADADQNGDISLEELSAVALDSARAKGLYDVAGRTDIVDLGAYVKALTTNAVSSFRANGKCTPEAAVTAP